MKSAPPGWPPDTSAVTEALIKEARRRQHRRYLLTGLAALVQAEVYDAATGIADHNRPSTSRDGRI
jgi:hypothetical protein